MVPDETPTIPDEGTPPAPPIEPPAPPVSTGPSREVAVGDVVMFLDQSRTPTPELRPATVFAVHGGGVVDVQFSIGDTQLTEYGVAFDPTRETERTWSLPQAPTQ